MTAAAEEPTALDTLLDRAALGPLQIRVAILCAFIAMLDGFDTQAIAFVAPVIGKAWGIEPARFGLIFSAGLLGIMLGQVTLAPLADRIGRKPIIILCTLLFGIFSLTTAFAESWVVLLLLRFLTGIGLGGATPNLITLTCEVSPRRMRATMITAMFAGFPLGAAIGGYISSQLIPAYGWPSVFIFGGTLPMLLVLIAVPSLPESPQFLHATGKSPDKLLATMRKITGDHGFDLSGQANLPPANGEAATGYAALFSNGLARITIPLWIA